MISLCCEHVGLSFKYFKWVKIAYNSEKWRSECGIPIRNRYPGIYHIYNIRITRVLIDILLISPWSSRKCVSCPLLADCPTKKAQNRWRRLYALFRLWTRPLPTTKCPNHRKVPPRSPTSICIFLKLRFPPASQSPRTISNFPKRFYAWKKIKPNSYAERTTLDDVFTTWRTTLFYSILLVHIL